MKNVALAFGFVLALAACSSDPTPPPVAYERDPSPKIVLDVKKISLADRSGSLPMSSPYKTNRFSPTIAEAIKEWAVEHLQAGGQQGQAIVLIKKASLTSQPLQMKDGIDSWFTRQQSLKYTAQAEVAIEASGQNGFAVAEASASRAVTLPEDPTDEEKQEAYGSMLNGLMRDLQDNLRSSIHGHMAGFIVPPGSYVGSEPATGTVDASSVPAGQ
jgi:hypothetical protein